ncbi:MAG: hypothetical protein U0T77_10775 [Chitinophagales bacterium]
MQDFILDDENDLKIKNGDFVVAESTIQEVALLVGLTQGQLKSDPILGPNLFYMMKSTGGVSKITSAVKLHLARDNKDFDTIKNLIQINAIN